MNFPDQPLFRFIYWILNTAGFGGIFVVLIVGGLGTVFLLTLYWIVRGARLDEAEQYTFPTSALLEHEE
jgi:hypothetical protein